MHRYNHFNSNFPGLLNTLLQISPKDLFEPLHQYFYGVRSNK